MTPTTGTCPRCKVERLLVDGHIAQHDRGDAWRAGVETHWRPCDGSHKRPVEFTDRARASRLAALQRKVDAARDYAGVALDAVLNDRHDMDVELPKLLKLAAALGALTWPAKATNRNSVASATRYWSLAHRFDLRSGSGWPGGYRGTDVYCVFCGELLASDVIVRHLMRERTERHTTPCALSCLAGLRVPVAPGTRRLPAESRQEEEQRA